MTSATPRGDERRTALLEALDHHLRQVDPGQGSLDSINIADISRRAGVTRSAFYFYFDNKASAVAALMEEMYDESMVAADLLRGEGSPAERVEGMVRGLFGAWERHEHIYRAMYDARATSTTVRELWDSDRESFVPVVAQVIEAERAAGRAPAGTDATTVASVLLELNDRMLERLALGGPVPRDELVDGGRRDLGANHLRDQHRRGRTMKHDELVFDSGGVECTAGTSPARATRSRPRGRPVVVMAHGFGGTKDSGLEPFADGAGQGGARRARLRLPQLRRPARASRASG